MEQTEQVCIVEANSVKSFNGVWMYLWTGREFDEYITNLRELPCTCRQSGLLSLLIYPCVFFVISSSCFQKLLQKNQDRPG